MLEKWKMLLIPLITLLLVFSTTVVAVATEPPEDSETYEKGKIVAVVVVAVDDLGDDNALNDLWLVTFTGLCKNTNYLNNTIGDSQIPISFSLPILEENLFGARLMDLAAADIENFLFPGFAPAGCWSASGGGDIRIIAVKPFIIVNNKLAAAKVIIKKIATY